MGIHACMNVVCESEGTAAAVLLRALEPLSGLEAMRARRGGRGGFELTNGPGKLCQAFGIGLEHNGSSALSGELRIVLPLKGEAPSRLALRCGPRIGLSRAVDLPYRFFIADSPWISRAPQNRLARRFDYHPGTRA